MGVFSSEMPQPLLHRRGFCNDKAFFFFGRKKCVVFFFYFFFFMSVGWSWKKKTGVCGQSKSGFGRVLPDGVFSFPLTFWDLHAPILYTTIPLQSASPFLLDGSKMMFVERRCGLLEERQSLACWTIWFNVLLIPLET